MSPWPRICPTARPAGDNTSSSQNNETRERVNYEVSSTEREITQGPGAIKRLTVAVLVNGTTTPDAPDGADPSHPDRRKSSTRCASLWPRPSGSTSAGMS